MKKKIIIIYSFMTFLTILNSCKCEEKHKITGPYEFTAVKLNVTNHQVVQIINFEFSLQYVSKLESASLLNNFSLITSTYARSCEDVFTNELVESDIELYCDKQFIYKNDTIEANTNLLIIPELKPLLSEWGSVTIDFRQSFLSNAILPKDFYVFKIKLKTNDQLNIEAEQKVYLDF